MLWKPNDGGHCDAMTLDALAGTYDWVNAIEGWTVAVTGRRPVDEVVGIYGGEDAVPVGEVAFVDTDTLRGAELDRVELFVQVLDLGDHTVTLEHNGFTGAFPEVARRCSVGGSFFSVYWNVNAAGTVTHAVDGRIDAFFESLFPVAPAPRAGDRRPEWAIGPAVATDLTWQVCMALLERRTGVAVRREWLTRALPTYRVPDPYRLYRDVEGAERI